MQKHNFNKAKPCIENGTRKKRTVSAINAIHLTNDYVIQLPHVLAYFNRNLIAITIHQLDTAS